MPVYYIDGVKRYTAYRTDDSVATQAYDINGNGLLNNWINNLADSGYSFTDGEETISPKLLFNFGTATFQSVVRNTENGIFNRASTDDKVYQYDGDLNALSTITLPSTGGHKNDGCYYDGNIYWMDGTASVPNTLYIWNISANTIYSITVPISNNPNGSIRVVAGICNTATSGKMYLVSRDQYNNSDIDHQTGDVMCVYEYDVANNTVVLKASFPWDCVYVQGATFINGKLYVACNTQTTGSASNYTGITIKIIDPSDWSIENTLTCSGDFEPQGCDSITIADKYYIWTGLHKYNTVDKVLIFEV